MGSLLLSFIMRRSYLFLLVLVIIIYNCQSLEGNGNNDGSEVNEDSSRVLANHADEKLLRQERSDRDKKKEGKKNGGKFKRRENKRKETRKGKKTNKGRKKPKTARKSKKNRQSKKVRKIRKQKQLEKSKKQKQLRKLRKSKRKNKKEKGRKAKGRKTKQSTVSCPNTAVNTKCLENALMSLAYEKNQVTNYIKQAKRLDNHQNISSNKLTKKNEFESAAKHMLWAIGGNLSDPKCGQDTNDTKRRMRQQRDLTSSIANYNKLLNCSETIKEACDLDLKSDSYNHSDHSENMTLCRAYKKDFINVSKECQSAKDQANATLQCDCWARAAKDVIEIKKLKCETKEKQKFITKHKNDCIKAFGSCKRMEDDAIELIHKCMHDHSNEFIGQTAESLHAAAETAGRAEFQRRLVELGISV